MELSNHRMISSTMGLTYHLVVLIINIIALLVTYFLLSSQNKKEIQSANGDNDKLIITRKIFGWARIGLIPILITSLVTYCHEEKQGILALQKQVADSTQAIKTERTRRAESETLRRKSDSLLSQVDYSLKISTNILKQQERELKTSYEILNRHIETNKYIVGGSGVPKLIMRISDINSSSQYKVNFTIKNNDAYTYYDVDIFSEGLDDIEKQLTGIDSLPKDSIMVRYDKAISGIPRKLFGPFILFKNSGKNISQSYHLFYNKRPVFGTEERFHFTIQWSTGAYIVSFLLEMKDYLPVLKNLQVATFDKIITLRQNEINKYFSFENKITPEIIDALKLRSKKYKEIDLQRGIH